MKYVVLAAVIFVLAGIIGIGAYLSPNDLSRCPDSPNGQSECQKADAIVAVSGGETEVRTDEAIRLYKNGWANYLIFSGAAFDKTGPSNAEVMRRQAIEAGVPESAILTENNSETTHQNAKKTDRDVEDYGIKSIILVTSPYHQRRAGLEFRANLDDSVIVLNHPAPNDPDWPWYWWLTPRGWWLAGGELAKITAVHAGDSR